MTNSPARRSRRRSALDSPWLSAALVVAVLAIGGAILLMPGLLTPGPGATASQATPTAAPTPTPTPAFPSFVRPTPSPQPSFTSYVVRPGDTLTSIATAFHTTARSIAWWNRGAYPSLDPESGKYNPNRLQVGWILVLLPNQVVDDTNPPTPSPGPSALATLLPSIGPTTAPTPKATQAALATVVSHGSRTTKNIALTFDMGGRLDPAVDIVQWLIDHDVHATLFPTGASGTQTTLGKQAMQLAATRPDLFDFGNHSWNHPDFRTLTTAQMADQLTRTETGLAPMIGSTRPWFRPPYGGWNDAVRAGVGAAGWRYLVMWDVDMIDWKPVADGGPTAADMVAKLRANAKGGSIVLMHLGGYNTLAALPGLLTATADLGLQPVTLREMLSQ